MVSCDFCAATNPEINLRDLNLLCISGRRVTKAVFCGAKESRGQRFGRKCVLYVKTRINQFVLVLANSGMNPFVYALSLSNFREALKRIATCRAFTRRLRTVSTIVLWKYVSVDVTESSV